MRVLLLSTFEMGRQPFGLASPAAWLRREGFEVRCSDLAREPLAEADVRGSELVGFHLPMHTATRLAAPVIGRVRALNPSARLCAYGLYAPLNAGYLNSLGVHDVFGGEYEEDLTALARGIAGRSAAAPRGIGEVPATDPQGIGGPGRSLLAIPRLRFIVPDRSSLPPLSRYATLQLSDGSRRSVGYTEASRGCRHLCRHCPVVPIYNGQFRVVPSGVVLADIDAQVAAGAGHITFGDPDFFNGPTHALRIVEALHAAHPTVTYDVTIKVEHLLRHRGLLPRLRQTGCLFVTSAVESLDDDVLALLEKGHTRREFVEVVGLCRRAGITLVPTFVAFHPWTSLTGYCDLLDTLETLELVDHVAPIQLAIRLLVPEGSRLLEVEDVRRQTGQFDAATLTYRWVHRDPAVDRLHQDVAAIVGHRLTSNRRSLFESISALAHERAGVARPATRPMRDRATIPYLNEPWYC
jgi:radical SAM superfamily enzyme YgiQ (UPF0313 family)